MNRQDIAPHVGDLRQFASVRRIVLDDGPERGVRALAFSTGGGLDFWVLADRSLDIGPVWRRGVPVAWQGHNGFRSPHLHDPEGDGGFGFSRSFSGFLVTCGLDHTRQPSDGHPLHGRLPFTPARVSAYGEDWERDEPVLFCEGEVMQARLGGEGLRLHRRIEAPIGGMTMRLMDRVTNLGCHPQNHEILYHFNLGHPAIGPGSTVRLGRDDIAGPLEAPDATGSSTVVCRRPPPDSAPDGTATCTVTTPSGTPDSGTTDGGIRTSFTFDTSSLPFLQVWRDSAMHQNVLGIEPCSTDRREDGRSVAGAPLPGGESVTYRLCVGFGETG